MRAINNVINLINKVIKGKNFCTKSNKLNLILSFNFYKNYIQIASTYGTDLSTLKMSEYELRNSIFSQSFLSELSQVLIELVAQYGATTAKSVHIILPDDTVVLDVFTLPQINGKMQEKALFSIIEKDYKYLNEICYKFSLILKNKYTANYIIALINNQIKSTILCALKNASLRCTTLTFSANCSTNFALKINADLKRKNALLIDENANFISFVAIINGKVVAVYKVENTNDEDSKLKVLLRMQDFAQNFWPINNCAKIQEVVINASNDLADYLIKNAKNLKISVLDCQEYKFTKNIALLGALYCTKTNEEFNFI